MADQSSASSSNPQGILVSNPTDKNVGRGDTSTFREYEGQASNSQNPKSTSALDANIRLKRDVQHDLLEKVLDGHYIAREVVQAILAPRDGPAPAILDIGTGIGSWAIAMAKEYPHTEVVGIDLVSPELREEAPPNCRFEVDDVNQPLHHYNNCFDVVHVRLVDSGIHDYPKFLNQVARMLRPGGIILVIKGFHQLFTQSCQPLPVNEEGEPGFTYLQKMFTESYKSIKKRGGSEDAALQYEYWFTQNPNYEPHKIVVRDLFIPIGAWSKSLDAKSVEICEMMRFNFQNLVHSFRPMLLVDGYLASDVDRWISGADKELTTMSVKGYSKWRFAWAIRTKAPWVDITT